MFNLILLGTSWCPVVLVVGLHEALRCGCWIWFFVFLAISVGLFFACVGILRYKAKHGKKQTIEVTSIESKDGEVLVFIFATILPLIRDKDQAIIGHPATMICILVITIGTLYVARAYHFNPIIRIILQYRCYSVKNSSGTSILLISKKDLTTTGLIERTVRLTDFVRLKVW